MTLRTKSLLFLLITATLWSMSGVLVKTIDWNPLAIASARSLVAALTIAFLARKTMRWTRPGRAQWIGAIFMALITIAFVCATKLTTAANAILLQYTAPVWVAVLAPLVLRERTSGRDWLFISIALAGMVMFFMDSLSAEGFWGIILAIFSGVVFAGLAISIRYNKGRERFQSVVYGNLLTVAVGIWFWRAPWPGLGDILLIVFAGVFQLGLAYYLFTLASEGVSSLEMVLVTALEPILNPIWVFLVVGEQPGHWALIGGAVVLLTITIWSVLKTIRPSPALAAGPTLDPD